MGEVRDVSVIAIYGGADMDKQIRKIDKGAEVAVATPGRMIDLIDRGAVDLSRHRAPS